MTTETFAEARAAIAALPSRLTHHRVLNVQCRRGHHVAAVYETAAGLVYLADTGPHGHGSKDYVDAAHGDATRGDEFTDLLAPGPMVADEVPAWCDCGHWTLSRSDLLDRARSSHGTVHLP